MNEMFIDARKAGRALAALSDDTRNKILLAVADEMTASKAELLRANELDLARMDRRSPLYDRLMLTEARIEGIASDMRNVA